MAGLGLGARRRRGWVLLGLVLATGLTMVAGPLSAFAAPNDEDLQHARQQLAGLVDLIERLDEASQLADALPLSDLHPSTVLSGIVDDASGAVDDLRSELASVPGDEHGDPAALANWLDDLDVDGAVDIVVGGPGADDADDVAVDGEPVVTKDATTNVVDIELSITVSKDVDVPIELATGLVDLIAAGSDGTFPVTFSLETSELHLRFDPALFANPTTTSQSLALLTDTTPTVTLGARTASGGASLSELTTNLGFTAISVNGSLAFDFGYELSLVDPDDPDGLGGPQTGDGRITVDEMTSIAVADLMTGAVVDGAGAPPAVNASLTIDSDLYDSDSDGNPAGDDDITVTYTDASLEDATDGALALSPDPSPLADFRNFSALDALGAVSRLVTMLDGLQNTGALDLSLPFVNGWDDPSDPDDSPQGTFSDAIGLSGSLADALTDPDTDGDGIPNADAVTDDDLAKTIDIPGGESEIGRPTFENAQQLVQRLDDVLDDILGEDVDVELVYDPVEKRLELAFPLHGQGRRSVELAFGDLDILSAVDVNTSGLVDLVGAYEVDLGLGLDLSAQPTEDGAGIGSCTDGIDNGASGADIDPGTVEDDPPNADPSIPLTDAGDPDCAGAQTLEQRVLVDVGDASDAEPELQARVGVSASGVGASARIGMLEASIAGGSFSVGGADGEEGDPADCANGVDDDGDGATDADDTECQATMAVDLTDATGDGWMTVEQVLSQLGQAVQGTATDLDFDSNLTASVRSTLPVAATLGGTSLAGGDIVVESDYSGPVTGALDLVDDITVDASDLHTSDLFDFSPCSNAEDDDGDGSINDGCDAVGEPEVDCADAVDDDSDGTVNDGCAPDDEPESNSAALFDQLIAALTQVADVLEDTGVLPADTLDAPLPIIGSSFNDLVSFVESLEGLADQAKAPDEASLGAAACSGTADDDGDDFVNDGCPTLPAGPGGLPEAAGNCANSTDDDGDGTANDGCPAVSPTLQQLSTQLATLLERALDQVGDQAATTVAAPITYDPSTKRLEIDLDVHFERTLTTPLTLDLPAPLGSIVSLDDLSEVSLVVAANLDLGFGVDLDDLAVFVSTDSHLDVSANASGEDIFFSAGVGSLQLQVGQELPVPEDEATQCADAVDSDGDGYVNDGCAPKPNPELGSGQCSDDNSGGDGKDDDGDGVADDGCGGNDPLTAGPPEAETGAQCIDGSDGVDDDGDGIADDGCGDAGTGTNPDAAANPETGADCATTQDGVDDDGDGFADDGCGGTDPATAGPNHPEGSASPGDTATGTGPDCAIDDADPVDDDGDGVVNDGCEPKADRARFFLGAKIDVDVVDDPSGTVALGDVDLDADFTGTPQAGCAGVVIPDDAHTVGTPPTGAGLDACAVLPLYLDVGGTETPVRDPVAPADPTSAEYAHWATAHHVLFAIDELTDPTDVAVHFDTTALDDFIQGQLMDLLLMESGIDKLLALIEDVLEADLLSFALPLIGGEGATAAGIVDDLRGTIKAAIDETISGNTWDPTFTSKQAYDALITPLFASLNAKMATAGLDGTGLTATLRCDDGGGTLEPCDFGAEDDAGNPAALAGDGDATNNCGDAIDDDGDGVADDGCPDPDPDDAIPPVAAVADPATTISDVEINLNIGRASGAPASVPIDFDLGIPGFSLEIEQGASLNADIPWNLTFGFGISKEHGFYFATHDGPGGTNEPELVVTPYVEISDGATMTGTLAFLQVDVTNTESKVDAKFTVDLMDPGAPADGRLTFGELSKGPDFGDVLAFAFQATADINLHIETGFVGGEGLPKLQADFELDWTWGIGGDSDQAQTPSPANFVSDPDALEPGAGSTLSIKLDNVGINAGSFISNFLAPIFKDIGRFTDPLMPIIDTVTACIPVLSDLSGECTNLIDLAGFFGLVENTETLDTIVGIVKFANALKAFTGATGVVIPLKGTTLEDSEFQLVGEALRGDTVTSNNVQSAFQDPLPTESVLDELGSAIGDVPGAEFPSSGATAFASGPLTGITEALDSIHVELPFLENPGKLMGILFGQDVDLILWEPPEFSFGFTYSQKFGPIWPTPPVFIEVGGSVSFAINFGIGYDTEGFRNFLVNDQGPSALLQGLFLIDRHPLTGGTDINELELRGELFANAQVSLLIFSAGAQGSIYLTIGVDLQDPNGDGKLKFNEAADIIRSTGNVLCIFNLNGEFGVRISVFAEVDLFFWSQRWEKVLAEIILYEFKVECEPLPDPILAGPESAGSTVLVLHMGDYRDRRGDPSVGFDETDENFKVTRTATGVTVSAFGVTQVYDGSWTKILARAADGEDVIALVDGKAESGQPPRPFDIPADLDGGTGPDQITGSTVADEIVGGDGDDVLTARDGANKVWGDTKTPNAFSGKDVIDTGKDHDEIWGGGGDDRISAGAGADTVEGNDGKDAIDGGRGVAAMNGQPAVPDLGDTIFGDNSNGSGAAAPDTDGTDDSDTIDGGDGDDFIYPSGGADLVNGGNGNDTIVDGGDPVSCGAPTEEDDILTGGPGADTISAGNGNDIVVGGSLISGLDDTGDSKLDGGNDCDIIFGDNAERPGVALVAVDPGVGGADIIEGGNGRDEIHGQVGGDTINGDEPGSDDVSDGNTGDTDGHDVIYGDEPDNTPIGDDLIFGDGGDDDIYGRAGADRMIGGLGDDEVFGEAGEDVMIGDVGSITAARVVTLSGGAGNDRLSGGPDDDRMYGQGGRDDVLGDSGDDTGYGDGDGTQDAALDGNDLLRGGVGNDLLFGNNGADDLFGEQGNDRLVGGSPNATSADAGRGSGSADDHVGFAGSADDDPVGDVYGDEILGGSGADVIAGDNATISASLVVNLLAEATIGEPDLLLGEAGDDRLYGEDGDDRIYGGDGDDHAEGGADSDEIDGDAGQDDLIGGTTENADGAVEGDQPDAGDTIRGGDGHDVVLGDNGSITRPGGSDDLDATRGITDVARRVIQLFDVATVTDPTAHDGFAGEDELFGGDDHDQIYGQGEDDQIDGGAVDDHLEGNAGNDTMWGRGGQDDIIGGTGRTKSDDPATAVDGRLDEAEDIFGGDGAGGITEDDFDVIMGDNATVLRPDGDPGTAGTQWGFNTFNASVRRTVFLYDVATTSDAVDDATHGADELYGEADDDLIYGQGDGDHAEGDEGDDYIEGNDGADTLKGEDGNDDVVGGTGRINTDPVDGTDGRLDEGEVLIQGGLGFDHIAGDNAIITRVLVSGSWVQNTFNDGIQHHPIRLLDIARTGSPASNATKDENTSGGDTIEGNEDDDLIYGQGNDASNPDGLTPVRDFLYGNAGDDYMEGNAGNDHMEGNAGQDDMIGGTGLLRGDPAAGVNGRFDGNDEMHGGDGADFQLGDNGSLVRPLDGAGEWTYYASYNPTTVVRKAARFDVNGPATVSGRDVMNGDDGDDYQWGQDDNDLMHGNGDNDDMYGELGADQMFGDAGQDAMVGDRGGIRDTRIAGSAARIAFDTKGPGFFVYVGLVDGQLDRRVSLTHDVDGTALVQPGLTSGGNDRMRGGPGHDSMHGAFGDDLMNGDSGGDWLFGADGADVLWGGKGADPTSPEDTATQAEIAAQPGVAAQNIRGAGDRFVDYLFGGHGGQPASGNISQQVLQADILDYLPRAADPSNGFLGDPDAWFEMTDTVKVGVDPNPGDDQYHQGIDWIYGGFDRDVMEGDVGVNGPDFGDRLIDWMGAYNMYTRCNASYGDDGDIRQISPAMQTLLQKMAYGSGAGYTAGEVLAPGTSAFRELGLVYPGDKGNNGKAFPTTPGNFNAIDCTPGAG